jgi:hypothetical protein
MPDNSNTRRRVERVSRWAMWVLGAAALFYLLTEHRAHLFGWPTRRRQSSDTGMRTRSTWFPLPASSRVVVKQDRLAPLRVVPVDTEHRL